MKNSVKMVMSVIPSLVGYGIFKLDDINMQKTVTVLNEQGNINISAKEYNCFGIEYCEAAYIKKGTKLIVKDAYNGFEKEINAPYKSGQQNLMFLNRVLACLNKTSSVDSFDACTTKTNTPPVYR